MANCSAPAARNTSSNTPMTPAITSAANSVKITCSTRRPVASGARQHGVSSTISRRARAGLHDIILLRGCAHDGLVRRCSALDFVAVLPLWNAMQNWEQTMAGRWPTQARSWLEWGRYDYVRATGCSSKWMPHPSPARVWPEKVGRVRQSEWRSSCWPKGASALYS